MQTAQLPADVSEDRGSRAAFAPLSVDGSSILHYGFVLVTSYCFVLFGTWNDNLLGIAATPFSVVAEWFFALALLFEICFRVRYTPTTRKTALFYGALSLDIVSLFAVLPAVPFVSFARSLRLLMIVGRSVKASDIWAVRTSSPYPLLFIYPLTVPIAAAVLFATEHNQPHASITTYFQAFLVSLSYSLTVGLFTNRPQTLIGDLICGLLFLAGVLIIGILANTVTQRYVRD